jgi:hypothetical protein
MNLLFDSYRSGTHVSGSTWKVILIHRIIRTPENTHNSSLIVVEHYPTFVIVLFSIVVSIVCVCVCVCVCDVDRRVTRVE